MRNPCAPPGSCAAGSTPSRSSATANITRKLTVQVDKVSASAKEKIEKAGGTVDPPEPPPARAKGQGAKNKAPAACACSLMLVERRHHSDS